MNRARLKQKRICKCFIKNIGNTLAYVRQSNATQRETSKRFTRLQARMHAQGSSLMRFSQNQNNFEKYALKLPWLIA